MHTSTHPHLITRLLVAVLVTVGAYSALPTERAEATTKWFPGHYFRVHSDKPLTNAETFLRHPETTGIQYQVNWNELEGAKGQYNFTKIDEALALAGQYGKKVNLMVEDRLFGTGEDGHMPAYMTQAGCVYQMNNGSGLKWWVPSCVDHFIDLYEAIGARYDCNITLASVNITGESALSDRTLQPGYSDEAYITQYTRAMREVKRVFPNTLVLQGFNFMPRDGLARIASTAEEIGGSGFVHPDTTPGENMGDATALEIQYASRGVPTMAGFQVPQLTADITNSDLLRWAVDTIDAPMWVWNHYRTDMPNYFADLLVYLSTAEARTLKQRNASCPSRLAPCVTTLSSCSSTYTPPPITPPPPTPSTCTNQQTSTASIPTGYGASYNPLTSAREYLVQASCTGTTQATVTAGNGNPLTYVYNRGYYWTGSTWTAYTLSCASGALIGGAWCPGRATASIPLPQNPTNVIAYTCQYTNSTWKCGCRDATCSTAYWQLQRVGR